ncbi:MAG: hypothetical protein AAFO07_17215 [Bacteroidota bacterium]
MKISQLIVIIILITLFSCKEPTFKNNDFPYLTISEATDINETGVTLNGTTVILPSNEVDDFGFMWDKVPIIESSRAWRNKVSLGNNLKEGKFSARVNWDFIAGEKYYIRAFAQVGDEFILSDTSSFISKGSTWTPWVKSPMQGNQRLCKRETVVIGEQSYSFCEQLIIYELDNLTDSASLLVDRSDDGVTELLFVHSNIAYYWFNTKHYNPHVPFEKKLIRYDLTQKDFLEDLAVDDEQEAIRNVQFSFCLGDYCYGYFIRRSNTYGIEDAHLTFKYNVENNEFKILQNSQRYSIGSANIHKWDNRIFAWNGATLLEYQIDPKTDVGYWTKITDFPIQLEVKNGITFNLYSSFMKDEIFMVYKAPHLWEYSLINEEWQQGMNIPGDPYNKLRTNTNIETSFGFFSTMGYRFEFDKYLYIE